MDLSLAIAVHASSFVSRLINLKALFFSLSLSLSSPFSIASIHLELINYYSVNFFFLFLSFSFSLCITTRSRASFPIYIYIHGSKGRVVHSLSIILEAITFLRYTIFTVTNGSSRLVAHRSIVEQAWKVVRCPQEIPISLLILPSQLASADSCPPRCERTTFHRPTTGK